MTSTNEVLQASLSAAHMQRKAVEDRLAEVTRQRDEALQFAANFLADYQADDGMVPLTYYAAKAYELIAKCGGAQ